VYLVLKANEFGEKYFCPNHFVQKLGTNQETFSVGMPLVYDHFRISDFLPPEKMDS